MILHPIIDLLKRIVVALPDYAGGGGGELPEGMNHTGSGEIMFASSTTSTTPIDLGTDFTPKFILMWTPDTIDTNGRLYFCGATGRNLTDFNGSFRFGYCKPSEDMSYYDADPDMFILNSSFIFGHGGRYYAPTTYYWFAFD